MPEQRPPFPSTDDALREAHTRAHELERVAEELRAERDRAQHFVEIAGTTLMAIDLAGRVTMLNRAGHELLGYEDGTLLGVDWFATCIPPDERERLRESYTAKLARDAISPQAETRLLCRDGSERTVAWHTSVLREGGEPVGLLGAGVDVTERRRAEEQVSHMAYHDSLTGLPNRMMLQEHLELALARARRNRHAVAILYLDLDDFKLVNDGLGHAAGDELLCQAAARIRRHVRDADTVARHGGDEFLVLLADLADDAERRALVAAQHIADAIREPYRISGVEFEIGGSVGISLFPADAQDAMSLLEHADAAMYEAKAESRGQVQVFRSLPRRREGGVERLSESRRLRRAIDGGELALHWQPIFTVADRVVAGVEALVRWEDPERGLRPAGDFIGVAERSGLVDVLDEWVLEAFSEQRRRWRREGLNPYVGFNLSPHQMRPERLAPLLAGLRAGGDLEHVTVELTEGVALRHGRKATGVLTALSEAGVTLSLDAFGVAYSSLSRLAELPVRWVKIDRSFMREVPANEAATGLLRSMVALVEALGMSTIVEGIESEQQARHMVANGWSMGQGYHLARPMPATDLEPLLRASPVSRADGA